ncbi:MAG: 16S rRNA (adenine(1518)-N(6)/adenine(1519)-N(6))-dimethyltransferase RsmA [Pseudomonadota bacterium]
MPKAGAAPPAVDGLPPLRSVISHHGLRAQRSLGQNFLLDLNLTGRIARAAGPLEGVTALEIGPGPGGLTRALLHEGAERVVAIERDHRCLNALAEIQTHYAGRLSIHEGDALAIDHRQLLEQNGLDRTSGQDVRIVANLPYNIATPLLTGWLSGADWPPFFSRLVLMFQREVADRIIARPGDAFYGRLSVLCGWRSVSRRLFDISPQSFTPPPKVTSTVVELIPKPKPLPCALPDLEAVTRAAFGQRRKMLRASLKGLGVNVGELLKLADLDGTSRAEEISIEGFVDLANGFRSLQES